jgi:hypothetical protein
MATATRATSLQPADAKLRNVLVGLGGIVTSTTGGVHAPNSYHYSGQAIDLLPSPIIWGYLYRRKGWFAELFGPQWLHGGGLYHNGAPFSDPSLQAEHQNHIHVAFTGGTYPPTGGTVSKGPTGGTTAGGKTIGGSPVTIGKTGDLIIKPAGGCPKGYVPEGTNYCSRAGGQLKSPIGNPLGGITDFFGSLPRYLELGGGGMLLIVGIGLIAVGATGVANKAAGAAKFLPGVGGVMGSMASNKPSRVRSSNLVSDEEYEGAKARQGGNPQSPGTKRGTSKMGEPGFGEKRRAAA